MKALAETLAEADKSTTASAVSMAVLKGAAAALIAMKSELPENAEIVKRVAEAVAEGAATAVKKMAALSDAAKKAAAATAVYVRNDDSESAGRRARATAATV